MMEMDERAKLCVKLANECGEILDDKLKEIGGILNPHMETGYFLQLLNNKIAFSLLVYYTKDYIENEFMPQNLM